MAVKEEEEPNELCAYCEKPGELITVRGVPGKVHLRCAPAAKKAWDAVRPRTFLEKMVERYGR